VTIEKVNVAEKLGLIQKLWTPGIVAEVNDTHVKLARVKGDLVWHSHAGEDELFLVIHGRLTLELRDGAITLEPGELAVIPAGVEHRPVAEEETHILLIEKKEIRHTGDVVEARTVAEYEWI
jgi:mannose-6-phosphate isomerase-like protein (cupin superfamily)